MALEVALQRENTDRFRHGADLYPLAQSLPHDGCSDGQSKECARLWYGTRAHHHIGRPDGISLTIIDSSHRCLVGIFCDHDLPDQPLVQRLFNQIARLHTS